MVQKVLSINLWRKRSFFTLTMAMEIPSFKTKSDIFEKKEVLARQKQ
jgi:hypothetical protein